MVCGKEKQKRKKQVQVKKKRKGMLKIRRDYRNMSGFHQKHHVQKASELLLVRGWVRFQKSTDAILAFLLLLLLLPPQTLAPPRGPHH
ncbi:hypothetical protein L6452_17407 [Arctium lappa]|uniref:Uncharacterized protein n=1 Tax=Arctium lappa TaxID=4217 RepID=A0ACB9C3H2_ARCLA|nr:hypothetical protein L6452_17407 [Arctium lappa]